MTMINWADYANASGGGVFAGVPSAEQVAELRKALTAGNEINAPGSVVAGDAFALRPESLENSLKNVTFQARHLKLFRMLPKVPAFNTVEEYNQIQSYGQSQSPGWVAEGELPRETDPSFERKYLKIKFIGTTRKVSHVATVMRSAHGNAIALNVTAGTMNVLEQVERGLFTGDSSLDPVQWDGLEAQIVASAGAYNVIDLRGQPLTEDVLADAAQTISDAPNYGFPTHVLMNPKVKADLIKGMYPRGRFGMEAGGEIVLGRNVSGFETESGTVAMESTTFLDTGGLASAVSAYGVVGQRPLSPTISTALASPVDATAQFIAADAGTYFYWVVAHNAYGNSAPVSVGSVAVAAGDAVTFGVTPGAGSPTVTYYSVYRTQVGGATGTASFIRRIANSGGVGETTITDRNTHLPYTTKAFMLQMNVDNIAFKQLLPMMRFPLPPIDLAERWAQVLYGAPVLYSPRRNVMIKNIGRVAGYAGSP